MAPGRVITAIGAGDSESREENESFGLGFGTMSDRIARLDAAVRSARDRGARVWVGGRAAEVRDVAATSADGWNAWGTPADRFGRWAEALRAVAVRKAFECTWGGLAVLDDDDASADAKATRLKAPSGTIVGGAGRVAEALGEYSAAGADWVIVGPVDSRDPQNAVRLAEVGDILAAI
jgi:alkanesulfonate monooxygenase SsuD/methylene tetrahydromethanopterin reductase-like flavin-dependent oxidoreductase (luciferase family)